MAKKPLGAALTHQMEKSVTQQCEEQMQHH